MKLRNLILPVMLVLLLGVTVCYASGSKAPIEVKVESNQHGSGIRIVSLVDTVTIQNVIINRGNSPLIKHPQLPGLPYTIKFGQDTVYATKSTRVIELEIQTDKGNWKYTFK